MSSQAGVLPATEERTEALLRRLPSPTAIFVLVLGVILIAITVLKGTRDPDYFWHLTTGRYIATHGIPSVDPFSFTWAGKPWTLHEWLGELGLYAVVSAVGSVGAVQELASEWDGTKTTYRLPPIHKGGVAWIKPRP